METPNPAELAATEVPALKPGKPEESLAVVEPEQRDLLARRKLADERKSITHRFSIASHEGYIIVGMYKEGTPGEISIKMAKEGSTLSGFMDGLPKRLQAVCTFVARSLAARRPSREKSRLQDPFSWFYSTRLVHVCSRNRRLAQLPDETNSSRCRSGRLVRLPDTCPITRLIGS